MAEFWCAKCDLLCRDPGGVVTDFFGGHGLCGDCRRTEMVDMLERLKVPTHPDPEATKELCLSVLPHITEHWHRLRAAEQNLWPGASKMAVYRARVWAKRALTAQLAKDAAP